MSIARTPQPPYHAVIFTSLRTSLDAAGYSRMAAEMDDFAARQPGYLGHESVRGDDGVGITVSYWRDEAALTAWKQIAAHLGAQHLGKERWYAAYHVRVCRVERDYAGPDAP